MILKRILCLLFQQQKKIPQMQLTNTNSILIGETIVRFQRQQVWCINSTKKTALEMAHAGMVGHVPKLWCHLAGMGMEGAGQNEEFCP